MHMYPYLVTLQIFIDLSFATTFPCLYVNYLLHENNTEVKFSMWVEKKFKTSTIFEHENGEK
jgi:hypothetical protein